jgi:LGFP repeat
MSSVFINKPVPQVTPDFDKFASTHPSIDQKVGSPKLLRAGFEQQCQNATAYGAFGSPPKEVYGAIRDRFVQFRGPDGWLGYPLTDETAAPDGEGRFNHFENGSIYWHPATGAFEVHGEIRNKWAALGWEGSWLGYPTSDEIDFADAGRISQFQHGSIYFWPDTGAIDLGDVAVRYRGLYCFGESNESSSADEPYVVLGTVTVPNTPPATVRITSTGGCGR